MLLLIALFACSCVGEAFPQESRAQQNQTNPEADDTSRVERLGEVTADEWEMDLAVPESGTGRTAKPQSLVLPDPGQDKALRDLLSKMAREPGNRDTATRLDVLLLDVLQQANQLIDEGSVNQAEQLLDIIQSVNPALEGLEPARQRISTRTDVRQLLIAANAAIESERFLEPAGDSAYFYFTAALEKDPRDRDAKQGLARLQDTLLNKARESAREFDFETADQWLSDAIALQQDLEAVESAREEVSSFKSQHAVDLEQKAITAMDTGDFDIADFHIIDLIALGGNGALVESLRTRLKKARLYGGYVPGQLIRDELRQVDGFAPEIVVISKGSFLMGSSSRSGQASDHEQPQHRVTLAQGFGLGKREVTVEEFRRFVQHTEYKTTAEKRGNSFVYDESAGRMSRRSGVNWRHAYNGDSATPDLPVIHVSMLDALAYVGWLRRQTGRQYRLPSEAEYEYVAKAGGNGSYWWGEGSPPEVVENLTGERDRSPSKREWTTSFKRYGDGHWGPGPAGGISSGKLLHPMGVEDIAGNISEWTEDCWHQNYVKAPVDGSAWVNPGCGQHVVRGGYWASSPDKSRAAYRFPVKADSYGPMIGIRVARDL